MGPLPHWFVGEHMPFIPVTTQDDDSLRGHASSPNRDSQNSSVKASFLGKSMAAE